MPFNNFTFPYALLIHDLIIHENFLFSGQDSSLINPIVTRIKRGGLPGHEDLGLVKSVLGHVENDIYYPKFEDKLSHLVFSVIKNHAFKDGNKRTAIALGAYSLELNGYDFCVIRFIRELENISVWVADNKIDKSLLTDIITSIIYDGILNEEIQIAIIKATE